MGSRRTLLRGVATLAAGSTLTGIFGTAGAADTHPEAAAFHDTTPSSAGTTLTARIDPSIRNIVGVPDRIVPLWNELSTRYPSIASGNFGPVSVSLSVEGESVLGGCATARGHFDSRQFSRELRRQDGRSFEIVGDYSDSGDRFVSNDSSYGVGIDGSTLTVGYDSTGEDALAHVESAVGSGGYGTPEKTAQYAPDSLDGDAVSYVTLGPQTRSRMLEHAGELDGLDVAIRNAEALGVSLTVGAERSRLQYGVVADPEALPARELWTLATSATDGDELTIDSVSRHGRMIVVDAGVAPDTLWSAHDRVFGSLTA